MSPFRLRRLSLDEIRALHAAGASLSVESRVGQILSEVELEGESALRRWAVELGDLEVDQPLTIAAEELADALEQITETQRGVLERVAGRIGDFAERQRAALAEVELAVPGGRVGHRLIPVGVAGCYAPGGRYPLPSSVLMTAVTARAAGVEQVWLASPRPSLETRAAAAIAGVDGLLAIGGAQAVAALAFGVGGVPSCDVVVGPGNVWVTTAKRLLTGRVGIDLLAGPSELVVLADETADPALVAADLLAQAEHDGEALPVLVTPAASLIPKVETELEAQLGDLSTAETAGLALERGGAVLTEDLDEAVDLINRLAPEHLQIMTRQAASVGRRCRNYGGLFVGPMSPEVLGDYGAGPNHTLPTGGTARFASGLSVSSFLGVRTWIEIDSPQEAVPMYRDAAEMASMEGLEAHRRAAVRRCGLEPERASAEPSTTPGHHPTG